MKEKYECPVVVAGDIFHKWDSPAELINFAIKNIPHGSYCIPGQHDLPNHNLEDIKRSAYWTLVEAGTIENMSGDSPTSITKDFQIHAFPWGVPVESFDMRWREFHQNGQSMNGINLAVIHDYCWQHGHSFPGCPAEKHVGAWSKILSGYSAAVIGDNHRGFNWCRPTVGDWCRNIYNHGGFIARNTDERDYTPAVGFLLADGTIKVKEVFEGITNQWSDKPEEEIEEVDAGIAEFVASLDEMSEMFFDFSKTVKQHLLKTSLPAGVKSAILKALNTKKERK